MTGRQIILPHSEFRIAEAFKYPSRLTEADLQELILRMAKDASQRSTNCRRAFKVGENYGLEPPPVKPKMPKWAKRKLSDAERLQLQSAWGN